MNLRIMTPDYVRNNLGTDRGFNMPEHKRGSMNLEYAMSLGTDVRDEGLVTHNSFNSHPLAKH